MSGGDGGLSSGLGGVGAILEGGHGTAVSNNLLDTMGDLILHRAAVPSKWSGSPGDDGAASLNGGRRATWCNYLLHVL